MSTPAAPLRKPPNEKLRAWIECVALVFGFAAIAVILGFLVWLAATLFGPIPALIAAIILFCVVVGTAVWLGNGKQRP